MSASHLTVITTASPASKTTKGKTKLRFKSNKSFFKLAILGDEHTAVVTMIEANPGFTVQEYAAKFCAQQGRPMKERASKALLINYVLVESHYGSSLAANGYVKLAPLGRKPKWFTNLPPAAQAAIKTARPADQGARLTFTVDPNADQPFCDDIAKARQSYADVSGFGKTRWFSQDRLSQMERGDNELAATQTEYIEVTRQLVAMHDVVGKYLASDNKIERLRLRFAGNKEV